MFNRIIFMRGRTYNVDMKRRRIRFKTKVVMALVAAAVVVLSALFLSNAAGVIVAAGSAKLVAMNTSAVYSAARSVFSDVTYESIIKLSRDENGDITSITADGAKLSMIARNMAQLTQTNLTQMCAEGVDIPAGAFTGIPALSGYGKSINVKIAPVVAVECRFSSVFKGAGINQTLHSVYINVTTDITLVLAADSERFSAEADFLLCESILNGKVPQIYLDGGNLF